MSVGREVRCQIAESRSGGACEDDPEPERPNRLALHPEAERSADGAMLCGLLEMKTAARKLRLIGKPVPTWIPKMIDSGTPSTTEPTTMPIAPPTRLAEARLHHLVGDEEDGHTDQADEASWHVEPAGEQAG